MSPFADGIALVVLLNAGVAVAIAYIFLLIAYGNAKNHNGNSRPSIRMVLKEYAQALGNARRKYSVRAKA